MEKFDTYTGLTEPISVRFWPLKGMNLEIYDLCISKKHLWFVFTVFLYV